MDHQIPRIERWTLWQDKTLTEMWAAGHSCEVIGARLGRTKNAIAGRCRRLNLPMRQPSIKRVGVQ